MTAKADPPEGFIPDNLSAPFLDGTGPYYIRELPDGVLVKAFRVEPRHCNSREAVHGGMMAALADTLLGHCVGRALGVMPATIRLTVDYLGPAKPGDWVEGTARVTHSTRSIAFAEGDIKVGGRTVARASAVFKLAPR